MIKDTKLSDNGEQKNWSERSNKAIGLNPGREMKVVVILRGYSVVLM